MVSILLVHSRTSRSGSFWVRNFIFSSDIYKIFSKFKSWFWSNCPIMSSVDWYQSKFTWNSELDYLSVFRHKENFPFLYLRFKVRHLFVTILSSRIRSLFYGRCILSVDTQFLGGGGDVFFCRHFASGNVYVTCVAGYIAR